MLPLQTEQSSTETSSEEVQNTETPQYRVIFSTLTLRVPVSSD